MKDFKLIFAGLILLLIVFIGIFLWLWHNNSKTLNPLPIMSNENVDTSTAVGANEEDEGDTTVNILNIRAEETLQLALDDIIVKFESRYPRVQILTNYVPANSLLTLPDINIPKNSVSVNNKSANDTLPSIASTDIIIADNDLSQNQLAPLQTLFNDKQSKLNQSQINTSEAIAENEENTAKNTNDRVSRDNNEARNLTSFGYALKDEQVVDGVILTNNPVALTFRNFILSSDGQDILKRHDYRNIGGYKNNMDDLFNGASNPSTSKADQEIEMTNILSNSE
ncbi:hypothetical protein [uncultured Psychrobacter sp.]|uniref:hypothetical protein n=1 Tax=uncultured Psychrobacter sp. TaxID=259303 RepID=UPI003458CF3C